MVAEAVYPARVHERFDRVRAVCHLGWLWGVWLASLPLITFIASPRRSPIYMYEGVDTRETTPLISALTAIAVLAGALPAIITFTSYRLSLVKVWRFALGAMPIFFVLQLSLLQKPEATDLASIILGLAVFSLAALNAADDADESRIRAMLGAFAVVQTLLMVWVVADGNFLWGRLMGRVGPNFWGATAFYTLFPALILRPRWLKAAVIVWAVVILYLSQNRSSMVAAAAGFLVVFVLAYLNANPAKRARLAWMALFGGAALVLLSPLLAEKILLLEDPRRGLDSGGTGRVAAWGQAWTVFVQHPWLGVGYRHHEHYISAASSAHNAYLATLADMGVIGFGAYLLLLVLGLAGGVANSLRSKSPVDLAFTGFVAGYAVQGMLEKRALNFGNAGSILFIFAIAWLMRDLRGRLPNLERWILWRRQAQSPPFAPAPAASAASALCLGWTEPVLPQREPVAVSFEVEGEGLAEAADDLHQEAAAGRLQHGDKPGRRRRANGGDTLFESEEDAAAWPDVAIDFAALGRQGAVEHRRPL